MKGGADLEQQTPEEAALLGAVLCDFDLPSSTSRRAVVILEENETKGTQTQKGTCSEAVGEPHCSSQSDTSTG